MIVLLKARFLCTITFSTVSKAMKRIFIFIVKSILSPIEEHCYGSREGSFRTLYVLDT